MLEVVADSGAPGSWHLSRRGLEESVQSHNQADILQLRYTSEIETGNIKNYQINML